MDSQMFFELMYSRIPDIYKKYDSSNMFQNFIEALSNFLYDLYIEVDKFPTAIDPFSVKYDFIDKLAKDFDLEIDRNDYDFIIRGTIANIKQVYMKKELYEALRRFGAMKGLNVDIKELALANEGEGDIPITSVNINVLNTVGDDGQPVSVVINKKTRKFEILPGDIRLGELYIKLEPFADLPEDLAQTVGSRAEIVVQFIKKLLPMHIAILWLEYFLEIIYGNLIDIESLVYETILELWVGGFLFTTEDGVIDMVPIDFNYISNEILEQ